VASKDRTADSGGELKEEVQGKNARIVVRSWQVGEGTLGELIVQYNTCILTARNDTWGLVTSFM
jgi:hypothetical protein